MGWPSFVNDVWKWMISIVVDFWEWFNGIQGSGFKVRGSGFKVQGCGGGFAASIWGDARRSYELTRSSYRELGNAIKLRKLLMP